MKNFKINTRAKTAFCFLFILTCSKDTTGPKKVTFSGNVTLEGETEHSGVTVRLYQPVQLDTALLRMNQQYPQIGVQISQATEFDHREYSAAYSTTTGANGSWRIDEVPEGAYNVVAEKDSFGWQCVRCIKL